jgi:hypothetical protein
MPVTLRLALVAGLVFSACARGSNLVAVAFPDGAPASGTEVLAVNDGRSFKVYAYALEDAAIRAPIPLDTDVEIEALLYSASLADLHLSRGQLKESPEGGLLPTTSARFIMTIHDGIAGPWRSDTATTALSSFRVDSRAARCDDFNMDQRLGPDTAFDVAIGLDASSAFIAGGGRWFRIDAAQEVMLSPIDGFTPTAAYRAPDGRIWLGGSGGKLLVGTPETGFSPEPSELTGADISFLDGPHHDEPFELFAVTSTGSFERFDGRAWTVLVDKSPRPLGAGHGGVAWVAPGEAYAAPPRYTNIAGELYHFRQGALAKIDLSGRVGPLVSLATIDGVGPLGVNAGGDVFRLDTSGFSMVAPKAIATVMPQIAAFRTGFVLASRDGWFDQYLPELEHFCSPIAISRRNFLRVTTFGEVVLVVGTQNASQGLSVFTFLSAKP